MARRALRCPMVRPSAPSAPAWRKSRRVRPSQVRVEAWEVHRIIERRPSWRNAQYRLYLANLVETTAFFTGRCRDARAPKACSHEPVGDVRDSMVLGGS